MESRIQCQFRIEPVLMSQVQHQLLNLFNEFNGQVWYQFDTGLGRQASTALWVRMLMLLKEQYHGQK